jgi:hypothetical protein
MAASHTTQRAGACWRRLTITCVGTCMDRPNDSAILDETSHMRCLPAASRSPRLRQDFGPLYWRRRCALSGDQNPPTTLQQRTHRVAFEEQDFWHEISPNSNSAVQVGRCRAEHRDRLLERPNMRPHVTPDLVTPFGKPSNKNGCHAEPTAGITHLRLTRHSCIAEAEAAAAGTDSLLDMSIESSWPFEEVSIAMCAYSPR